jgi:hypothetical protein
MRIAVESPRPMSHAQARSTQAMSNDMLQVGDRVVVIPRTGSMASVQISGRVLATKGSDALRLSWGLEGSSPFKKGDEFLVIGRDIRRRSIYMSGDENSVNMVMREAAGDGRSNRRFARVESLLRYSWRNVSRAEVEGLEFKVRDAVGLRKSVSSENVSAPKTQLGDYLEKRLGIIEELLRQVLERVDATDPIASGMTEGVCDLSGSGMVFPVDGGHYLVAVAFTAISPADQEAIVRYNFQVERSRRRKAVEGEGQHTEFSGEIPALTIAQRKDLAACPLQVDDYVELCFTLPLEVPTEIRCVARTVRLESGHNS